MGEKIYMKKVLVTGAKGLVGSAIIGLQSEYPELKFISVDRKSADLTNELEVEALFESEKPDYVIHTAARVGGIGRNLNSPVLQFKNNILMNTHVINQAHQHGVEKLIAFSSVCVFPADAKVLREDNMHDGAPFPAHWSYAMAKRMVDVQIDSYKKQYNSNYCSVIPANIFGENDNFNLEDGHVVPSLIHKCFRAKKEQTPLVVWGDGSPKREFLYARDVARACIELLIMEKQMPQRLIVSGGQEIAIKELVEKICKAFNYNNIEFDKTKPNGQMNRVTDMTLFKSLFPTFQFTNLDEAIKNSVEWFEFNYPDVRK